MTQWHKKKYAPHVGIGAAALLVGLAIGSGTQPDPEIITKTDTVYKTKTKTETVEVTPPECLLALQSMSKTQLFFISAFQEENAILGRSMGTMDFTEFIAWSKKKTPLIKKQTNAIDDSTVLAKNCIQGQG